MNTAVESASASATAKAGRVLDEPAWLHEGRVPGLDALRAFAAGFVVVAHMWGENFPRYRLGVIGVDCFFVLSGFLITLLMTRERAQSGTVDLQAFYVRRSLRIFPAYYVYLGTIAILGGATTLGLWLASGYLFGFYLYNFGGGNAAIGHTWTLSAEEFFYLVWPFVYTRSRNPCFWLWTTLAIMPFARLLAWQLPASIYPPTLAPLRLDGLALGSLLAIYAPTILVRRWPLIPIGLATLAFSLWFPSWRFRQTFQGTANAFGMAALILGCVSARGLLARLLDWRPLVAIGTLSYSIYLWHMPFVTPGGPLHMPSDLANVAATLACAAGCYYAVERPFLQLKKFWHQRSLKCRSV